MEWDGKGDFVWAGGIGKSRISSNGSVMDDARRILGAVDRFGTTFSSSLGPYYPPTH